MVNATRYHNGSHHNQGRTVVKRRHHFWTAWTALFLTTKGQVKQVAVYKKQSADK